MYRRVDATIYCNVLATLLMDMVAYVEMKACNH